MQGWYYKEKLDVGHLSMKGLTGWSALEYLKSFAVVNLNK